VWNIVRRGLSSPQQRDLSVPVYEVDIMGYICLAVAAGAIYGFLP
jgi:hypothetical protein